MNTDLNILDYTKQRKITLERDILILQNKIAATYNNSKRRRLQVAMNEKEMQLLILNKQLAKYEPKPETPSE